MENIKNFLLWLVTSTYGIMTLGVILMFGGLVPLIWIDSSTLFGTILYYIGLAGTGTIAVMILIGIAYAWVINPINMYKANKAAQAAALTTSGTTA